jgi:CBS domain-containing protein
MKIKQKCVKDIQDLLVREPTCITADRTVSDLLKAFLQDPRTRHVYVVDNDHVLIGSLRLNDIVEFMSPYLQNLNDDTFNLFFAKFSEKKVKCIMCRDFLYLKENAPLAEMVSLMLENRVNELPVVGHGNRVIGEVNFLELVKFLSDNEHLAIARKAVNGGDHD